MPANRIDSYLQDARNNFDAVRPAPICGDANQAIGQYQNVHVSTNCYYGYHDLKSTGMKHVDTDCEMVELGAVQVRSSTKTVSKKRCADEQDYPQTKRPRDGLQEVETATKLGMEASCLKLEAQCDEFRLYFRGYGAIDFQLQPMFTTPNPQQP